MKEYHFTTKEYNKWTKSYQEVLHHLFADSLEEAIDRFYIGQKNYGWSKEDVRRALL